MRRRVLGTALPLLALVPLLFVLDRAVNHDDVLFLRAAAQIRLTPARPYATTINWFGWTEPLWGATKNPPGVPYWLAAVQALGGTSERAWHLALLPFAVASALAGARLARRFAPGSVWVTVAWVASPAFLVSASTLMVDVPALAFTLWGVALWVEGVDAHRRGPRLAGALLTGLGIVVKYSALVTAPVLLLYALLLAPRVRWRALLTDACPLAAPAAVWTAMNLVTDGRAHLLDSLIVSGGALAPGSGSVIQRGIALLCMTALAGVFPMLFVVLAPRGRAGWAVLAVSAGLGALAVSLTGRLWPDHDPAVPLVVAISAALGACAVLTAGREAIERRGGRETLVLAIWVGLQALFAVAWSWTVAARFVLPVLPPLALLLWRSLAAPRGRDDAAPGGARRAEILLGAAAVVACGASILLLPADAAPGNYHRLAVPQIARQIAAQGGRGWLLGAWSLQYYGERAGLVRVDERALAVRAGDVVVGPYYAANRAMPAALERSTVFVAHFPGPEAPYALLTLHGSGAGFYTSQAGPLPFWRAHYPVEGIMIWRVLGPP